MEEKKYTPDYEIITPNRLVKMLMLEDDFTRQNTTIFYVQFSIEHPNGMVDDYTAELEAPTRKEKSMNLNTMLSIQHLVKEANKEVFRHEYNEIIHNEELLRQGLKIALNENWENEIIRFNRDYTQYTIDALTKSIYGY